jgi:hypothetical protein
MIKKPSLLKRQNLKKVFFKLFFILATVIIYLRATKYEIFGEFFFQNGGFFQNGCKIGFSTIT